MLTSCEAFRDTASYSIARAKVFTTQSHSHTLEPLQKEQFVISNYPPNWGCFFLLSPFYDNGSRLQFLSLGLKCSERIFCSYLMLPPRPPSLDLGGMACAFLGGIASLIERH